MGSRHFGGGERQGVHIPFKGGTHVPGKARVSLNMGDQAAISVDRKRGQGSSPRVLPTPRQLTAHGLQWQGGC